MYIKQVTGLLVFFLCFPLTIYCQDQIRIMDSNEESVGRFKTQLYELDKGELTELRGNSPKVTGNGDQIELVLKLYDLRWFDEAQNTTSVNVKRSDIALSDPKAIQVASSPSEYKLSTDSKSDIEIRYRVLSNGKFSMKVPFKAGTIKGQYQQMFEVKGLSGLAKKESSVGAIADLKKEWRDVDKKSLEEVQSFIDRYESNEIAIEERLIAVAERTKLRIDKNAIVSEEEEEAAWAAIGEGTDEDLLRNFIDKFPDSKYVQAAKAKLGEDANVLIRSENESRNLNSTLVKVEGNNYKLDLSHLGKVEIELSDPDELEITSQGGNIYGLDVKGSKEYKISVREPSTSEKLEFILDNRFNVDLEERGSDLIFQISGGVSPYTVEFIKAMDETSLLEGRLEDLKVDNASAIEITKQMLSAKGMDGNYRKVVIRDFTTEAMKSFPIDIDVSPQRISTKLVIGLLLGAIIIGGGIMFFYNRNQNQKRQVYKEKAKVFQQTQKIQQVTTPVNQQAVAPPPTAAAQKHEGPRKITISKQARKFVPANGGSQFKSSGRMKITKREGKGGRLTGDEFRDVLAKGKYAFLDLTELWPDTAIKELYVSKDCVKELGKFLKEENLDKVITEMEGAIPEVGGFLMGYHQLNENGFIRVTMDEFVPFVPEYHDVFKIEIGTATLVQELGDAQDKHPDKDVIGWFHTHPGHGLFLSNSDLSVQRHFPLKYQIAMEIDSLTETLDTAFFTRKVSGAINNVEHRKKGANWFSWKKIENI